MLNETAEGGHAERGLRLLSPRELEVLAMTSRGLTNVEIAAKLSVSVHAVKFHLAAIYRKLDVANRTEAAVAFSRGQLAVDSPGD